ncbi:MAG TPA: sulfotransferase, partial [Solirubrobacteraceae bacterium]|nr:sulfotransferase [Solirubrobacteraceae bacterium]
AAQPRARIVALLREPVAFLRSLQLELVRNHVELERDFERAIANESIPAIGEGTPDYSPPIRRYSDRIRYVEQLRRFHEAFPAEQVLVLIYEDFRRDNAGTLRQVLAFLGVDPGVALEPSQANPTMDVRSVGLDRLVQAMYGGRGPLARGARRTIRTLAPRRLRGRGFQALRRRLLYAPPKAPPEDFALRLRARFRPEVVALSDYLGRDLVSEWGYGRVG